MGIAFYTNDGMNVEKLLKNADTAMYMAKVAGKSTFGIFSPELDTFTNKEEDFKMVNACH
jgi:predicted signal transduction protein with EAL and GGDEF domain